tara:strand:+ start:31 stop:423 length:393 start_codon:yes stop_codon:yes gene_type:complete
MSKKTFYSLEFDFQASPQLLFQYLSTPSGLSEWFADNVNSRGEDFVFIWDDSEEEAKMIQSKNNERVRFQWMNDEEDSEDYYFEFKIQVDEITKDLSLIISDFSDDDEVEESKLLWRSLIADLKQVLGSS